MVKKIVMCCLVFVLGLGCSSNIMAAQVNGVKDGEFYNQNRTITWDKSKVRQVKINGTVAKGKSYKLKVSKGKSKKFKIAITDMDGKTSKISCVIDKIPPTIKGVTKNKIYISARTVKWSDNTGIAKLEMNGVRHSADFINKGKYKVTLEGTHSFKIWDKAGNSTRISFTVWYSYKSLAKTP